MGTRSTEILLTAIAPAIWGSTYLVTTEFLPAGYPVTVAMLRALPAGLLLLLVVRQMPTGVWLARSFVLGALNFSFFQTMLFVSAYRLPGGVAATVGAIQPLIVIVLSRIVLGSPARALSVVAGIAGMAGVALLVLTPKAALDPVGVAAGLAGAVSMAFGTVLSRHWTPPVSPLTFTAWQLAAGGLPPLTAANIMGFTYLGLIGTAFTYLLWFRGLSRLEPSQVSPLGFLSPVVAILIGWGVLDQQLTAVQVLGIATVFASVWMSQYAQTARRAAAAP
ncbi:EamA family transporter [Sinorhizobium meliloti]|uniref:EamA family transporter n=1 Tax=Rhizobium meliloti TaxID=382 RepID=UPI000FD75D16|nr:EamA family transporter [Sinorhizobium meliloti]RVI76530.1 EamA family transporter [Sinorhizobium meliloti]